MAFDPNFPKNAELRPSGKRIISSALCNLVPKMLTLNKLQAIYLQVTDSIEDVNPSQPTEP